jgi:hypothetical protein
MHWNATVHPVIKMLCATEQKNTQLDNYLWKHVRTQELYIRFFHSVPKAADLAFIVPFTIYHWRYSVTNSGGLARWYGGDLIGQQDGAK